ncbi:hypothetical protein [Paenibacillus sp. EPM92]|uniref:hypothetical protein n=1 Tax=Paenibacillus sp. EPM92 TaxID=1561195 RepID=UPI001915A138|nr:hypothetical protein [Paenibacillus sp. EPM92]
MRAAKVVMFGLLGGGLIFLFSIMQDLSKYVFSLGALYVGYQFFTRNDSRAMRIGFVAAAVGLTPCKRRSNLSVGAAFFFFGRELYMADASALPSGSPCAPPSNQA